MAFWGAHRPHAHLSRKNLMNAALCVLVLVVWKQTVDSSVARCETSQLSQFLCKNPVVLVSLLLFFVVSVLFWVIGLVQRSFWLIDAFWTLIPLMITYFYVQCAAALSSFSLSSHSSCVLILLSIWALRLAHSYFRREGWKFGEREDWRYTLLAQKCGKHWWWMSFWVVGVLQQFLLTGLTLPVYSVLFRPSPAWSIIDSIAVVLCGVGIGIAFAADNDLYQYMTSGPKKPAILNSGLWQLSRHPNYFGEQLFWWSLFLFSVHHGDVWALIGPLSNSLVLIETTRMTEERMIQNWEPARVALYRRYQKTTSAWIPWPNA